MPLNYLGQQWKLEKDNHHTREWKELRIECRKDLNDIEMQIDDIRVKLTQDILSLPILPYSLIEKEKELKTLQQGADRLNRIITTLDRNILGVVTQ